ncbi:hypothetical protein [Paraburkholderia phenoliruptrix]|nr:hypothetical protein [Paraburkholderia phenoliruptrix]MDR6422414.1 hypothetical protein [Paraburkholderia phenoliruptrix]CAB4050204.1 hypothetical protein LMG9964_03869 [Paraburkholderia phenoliruptrix]
MAATKKAAMAEARERGEDRFVWTCKAHGDTAHYSKAHGACVECTVERNRRAHARRVATSEGREARRGYQRERRSIPGVRESTNAYQRQYDENRRAADPAYLGASRERVTAHQWRKATGAKVMPAWYSAEQVAIRRVYAECPEGHHVDHLVPKVAQDYSGNTVAVGLHCLANLQVVPQRLNLKKSTFFDPDNVREQRPANAFPGGAWDPELTEREWARVELLVRRYGCDRNALVRTIQAQVARQHQTYLATSPSSP